MKPSTLFVLVPALILAALFSVANRGEVVVRLDPFGGSDSALSVAMPLYLVVFAALLAGVLLGGATVALGRRRARARRLKTKEIGAVIAENAPAEFGKPGPGKTA
jgi:uncharacterized integral membrane protein